MTGSQVTLSEACARAARVLATARAERDELAASGGPEAVALWAAPGCTPQQHAELAAYYGQLQARQRTAGGTSAA